MSLHLTGLYPKWWVGRRWSRPTHWWASNTNNETVRDNPQRILLGAMKQWGTGTIPLSCIAQVPTMSRGFPDLVDTVPIRHKSGGISTLQFKAYEQGRERWAGATKDGIWYDEEPPEDVYTEGLARISATGGMVFLTLTPLLGMSEVVSMFYPEPTTEDRALVRMEIEDAEHFTPEERKMIVAAYPEHERDARSRGYPMLGSGKIFAVPQSSIEVEPFEIPKHFARLGAMDFGWGDHPFAAIELCHDRDSDIVYLTKAYKDKSTTPAVHRSALRHWGEDLTFVWPHDGHREWGDSGPIAELYRQEGIRMWRTHSTFKQGGYSTEAGVEMILSRMQTGRFKVFSHLAEWWTEFNTYHRKDGLIVKKKDDLLSATRQGMMMLRYARLRDVDQRIPEKTESEWDVFAEA